MSKYFSDSHSQSQSQSQSLSAALIQYPHIEFTTNTKSVALIQNPPSVALRTSNHSDTIAQSAADEGQSRTHVPSAKCSSHNDNDNGDVIIRTRFSIPTRNENDFMNCSYDESCFPAELCINWNMIQAARMDSSPVSQQGVSAPTSDLHAFVLESPTRAMAYITSLASLQQNFSQQVASLRSVISAQRARVLLLLLLGFTIFTCGIPLVIPISSCTGDENGAEKSGEKNGEQTGSACSTNVGLILAGVVFLVFGLVLLLCGAVLARKLKRLFAEELEKKSCALTLCGHGASESSNSQTLRVPRSNQQPQLLQLQKELGLEQQYQQLQQQLQQRESAWHAEVRFEAGSETFSVVACFTISWKTCNEQCAQHRSSCPLVQVVVDHNGSAHTQSQSQSQS